MELNHQIRFCRPFPFLFGFRAICEQCNRTGLLAKTLKVIREPVRRSLLQNHTSSDSSLSLHKVPPPKESMRTAREESLLEKEHNRDSEKGAHLVSNFSPGKL